MDHDDLFSTAVARQLVEVTNCAQILMEYFDKKYNYFALKVDEQVFVLCHEEGCTQRETSEALGIGVKQVSAIMAKWREKVAEIKKAAEEKPPG